jgi:ABC-2 type transport system permease protein
VNTTRIFTLAGRVIRQIIRDRRTVALFLIGPLLALTLAALVLRAPAGDVALGVVNEDEGATIMLLGQVSLADQIVDRLAAGEGLRLITLRRDEVDQALREGRVRGVAIFPSDFSASFAQTRHATITLRLEGSNPMDALALSGTLLRTAMQSMAGLAPAVLTGGATSTGELPLELATEYLYGGPQYDTLDYIAPVYIALIVFFFVFLLTTVSFLRERSQGTIERLFATPVNRFEIVTGYMLGFLVFALAQAAILLLFTVGVLGIHYAGSLLSIFLIEALLVIVAVNLGIFLSTFAHNEFQVLQFIPLVIIPMALLSGLIWPVADLPDLLRPFAYVMPLTYANQALRDIMIKGWGLADVWLYLVVLAVFAGAFLVFAATTMRREVA